MITQRLDDSLKLIYIDNRMSLNSNLKKFFYLIFIIIDSILKRLKY